MRVFRISMSISVFFVALLVVFNIGATNVANAKNIEWTMYTIMPAAGYFGQGFAKLAEMVEKESNGKLKIKIHFGGALGFKASELLPVIKNRMVDISEVQLMKNDGTEKFLGINSLPFIVKDLGEAHILDIVAQPYYEKAVNRWGGKMLFSFPFMPSQIHSKMPLNSIADLKGVKVRVYDKNGSDAMKAVGAVPVTIPWAEVYTSLQRHVMEAVLTSNMSACDAHFWEVLKTTNIVNILVPVSSVVINQAAWNDLPCDLKVIVSECGKKMRDWFWFQAENMQATNTATLKEHGMSIVDVDPKVHAEIVEKTKFLWDKWIEKVGPDGKAALEKFWKATGK